MCVLAAAGVGSLSELGSDGMAVTRLLKKSRRFSSERVAGVWAGVCRGTVYCTHSSH